MTDLSHESSSVYAAPRRSRRRTAVLASLVLVVLAIIGYVAVRTFSGERESAQQRAALAELERIGSPANFRPVAPMGSSSDAARYDDWSRTGMRQYGARARTADIETAIESWLDARGYGSADDSAHSSQCAALATLPTSFTCGNFFHTGKDWRVWAEVQFERARVQSTRAPLDRPLEVWLTVHVQPRMPVTELFVASEDADRAPLRSPGLDGSVPPGNARTVVDWSGNRFSVGGARFTPGGDLIVDLSVLLSARAPAALVPVKAGESVRPLVIEFGPTFPDEPGAFDGSYGGAFTLSRGTTLAADGSLWVGSSFGVRRISADGDTSNVFGYGIGVGSAPLVAGDSAIARGARLPLGTHRMAVTTGDQLWIAADTGLLRVSAGRADKLTDVEATSVVADGQGGVFYSTATQAFHRDSAGTTRVVAGAGPAGSSGHAGPADRATFDGLSSLAVMPDGSLLVQDSGYLVRVGPDGTTSRIAGTGGEFGASTQDQEAFCAKPVPALAAELPVSRHTSVIASPRGGLYVVGCNRLVQIGN